MKNLFRAALVVVASTALAAGGIVPANAAKKATVNVTKLSAPSVTVTNAKCKAVKVKVKKKSNTAYWDVFTKVRKGGKNAIAMTGKYSRPYAEFHGGFDGSTTDKIKVCPKKIGLGKVTMGPSDTNAVFSEWGNGHTSTTDKTKGHFYIRGKAKASLSAKRTGGKVKLTASARKYQPKRSKPGYVPFNRTVKFQVKSGSGWKTLKSKKLKNGSGSITVKKASVQTYRVTFSKISTATGATSKTVRR